jgi:LuxR family maltose regulon positive regulatory protein
MSMPILVTKLYIPRSRSQIVPRPRLIERLNDGLERKLTLIAAPAGFGKTTLVSDWLIACDRPAAWLSLDEGDSNPAHFLTYLVAALKTIEPEIGAGVLRVLQTPQPPPTETILTTLLNELIAVPYAFALVLDDYHLIDAQPVDSALAFLLDHLPPQMHLVIAAREDPPLPLARLRARGQLTELRVADLRFTPDEAAAFLNQVMGLDLTPDDVAALETRTEGWIAGLQLAAISMQSHDDRAAFIRSFTGSHHFVLDYLVEEVLHRQPESVQTFLLRTSILARLCGPLCDAVLCDPSVHGQSALEAIEAANLFLIPLDNERRWYRYHHLFADLLRQRLRRDAAARVPELHLRASRWCEANGLQLEAFQHAAAAGDIERAVRLVEGEGVPLYFRGEVAPVLHWLDTLPDAVMAATPALRVMLASVLSIAGQNLRVEPALQAAEAALAGVAEDAPTRDLIGRIAAIRATLAATRYDIDAIREQSQRALDYLHPDNLPVRTHAAWSLGMAYQYQGQRDEASAAYTEAIAISEASGNTFVNMLAATCLGIIRESDMQLHQAEQNYRRVLEIAGDPPPPTACEAYFGLARLACAWNDLDAATEYGELSVQLAREIENIDSAVMMSVFLARLKLARGDGPGATSLLADADQFARQHDFQQNLPEVAAAQVDLYLRQGNLAAADNLSRSHDIPVSQARVHLAEGDPSAALAALEPARQQAEAMDWPDEQLKVMVVQALAHHADGDAESAAHVLDEALALAQPGGIIRSFVDEGPPMAELLADAHARGVMPDYTRTLLAAFDWDESRPTQPAMQGLLEPLSERELEVLQLVAEGLSNREISERLYLALDTVKGHNRRIYGKLQVQRRTEAVARAQALGLI